MKTNKQKQQINNFFKKKFYPENWLLNAPNPSKKKIEA